MGGQPAPLAMTTLRERMLIRRLQQRDERAFAEVMRLYQHKVFNLVFRMVGNREEAEDVAQEVFVTVFKHVETFRGDAKFSTWLYRIATNHTRNRMKYLGRRSYNHPSELDEAAERAAQDAQPSTMRPQIAGPDGIAQLEPEHREVLVLRAVENLSYEESASITAVAEGTVKSRLHRARL